MKYNFFILLVLLSVISLSCASKKQHVHTAQETSPDYDPLIIATNLSQKGDHLSASYYLEVLISKNPQNPEYLKMLIESQIRAGRLVAARLNLEVLVEKEPKNNEAIKLLGIVNKLLDPQKGTEEKLSQSAKIPNQEPLLIQTSISSEAADNQGESE
jgi:Flp pilus assembly protein TadD